jgi:NADH:ubiquinone reductase (H+-translocating)
MMIDRTRPRVVIVGAGFGGLWAARALAKSPVEVLLIDCNNYHTFLPLLYQVAAAEQEPEEIAYPVRSIVRKLANTQFVMAEVTGIDFVARRIETTGDLVQYDYLVLALGSTSHFFGVAGADKHAFPLKTLEQGIALRNHILCCFERAMHASDMARRRQLLTFTIVGGGPTGVEFAGALTELIRGPMVKDYPTLDLGEVQLILLEAMGSLLANTPSRLSAYALARLRKMGVDVRLQTAASEITATSIRLKDDSTIPTETVIWTAGVRGAPLAKLWGLPLASNGQVKVTPTLQVPDYPEVYAIGDLAYVEEDGRPLPLIAPVAIQQGVAAARNITRQITQQAPLPFRYRDKGTLVTIGRNAAVAYLGGRAFTGFPAWVLWLGVHIFNLIGFRNRMFVLLNWAWDYFSYERAIRLILPAETRSAGEPK